MINILCNLAKKIYVMPKIKKELEMQRWIAIVQSIANGKTVKEIGVHNSISPRTIEGLISRAFLKYDAVSMPNLIAIFFRKKLIK